jgi:pimeloyl-ACP methyl ester carboxylesterase
MLPRVKRRVRVVLKVLVILLAVLCLGGTVYEQIGRWRDRKRFPQLGRSVDIGGRTLNLYCTGEGAPAVILESGPHTAGYGWMRVQPGIARFTRACWYDRAGYGWSDPGPFPRTNAAVAKDLHSLLRAAAIPPPYVLVGHAGSGYHVRAYNNLFPKEVAGVVLVDAANPDQFAYEPKFMKGPVARIPRPLQRLGCALLPVMSRIGLIRLLVQHARLWSRLPPDWMSADDWVRLQMLSYQPTAVVEETGEGCYLGENASEVRAARSLGDRPLIVLTSGKPFDAPDPAKEKETAAFNEVWVHQLQPELARLSTRGRQVIVPDGNFGIPNEAPEALVQAVREVVQEIVVPPL